MKNGLVLEGGGMRGMFSAGVIDEMMEQNIRPDGIIGVSAGATFGCNFKSNQKGRSSLHGTLLTYLYRQLGKRSIQLSHHAVPIRCIRHRSVQKRPYGVLRSLHKHRHRRSSL